MIGDKLSELLELRNMKAGTLARLAGVPKSTIYGIIKRNNKNVDFSIMEKICDILEVPIDYFYDRSYPSASKNTPVSEEDDERMAKLIELFDLLNEEGQDKLIDYADDLVYSRKYIKRNTDELAKEA